MFGHPRTYFGELDSFERDSVGRSAGAGLHLAQDNSVIDHMQDNRWSKSACFLEQQRIGDP
jgi:hypothetical protein